MIMPSMKEVITRRLSHAIKENTEGKTSSFTRLPDLILMDGGKTQVHAAEEVLLAFGMDIPVCGMVKDDRHRTRDCCFMSRKSDPDLGGWFAAGGTRIQGMRCIALVITYQKSCATKEIFIPFWMISRASVRYAARLYCAISAQSKGLPQQRWQIF